MLDVESYPFDFYPPHFLGNEAYFNYHYFIAIKGLIQLLHKNIEIYRQENIKDYLPKPTFTSYRITQ